MATYACADLHGRLDLYEKIKEYINPEDNVFFLGDAIDRGPHGVEIMLDILKQKNWIYLKGNHEDMMYAGLAKECGLEIPKRDFFDRWENPKYLWYNNGGKITETSLKEKFTNKELKDLLITINDLPLEWLYKNTKGQTIHLSHAGWTPSLPELADFIWSREHFLDEQNAAVGWDDDNYYVVHGHTPTQSLSYCSFDHIIGIAGEICKYGHKIDIDCGAVFNNKVALLDLDTLEPIYFYHKIEE